MTSSRHGAERALRGQDDDPVTGSPRTKPTIGTYVQPLHELLTQCPHHNAFTDRIHWP